MIRSLLYQQLAYTRQVIDADPAWGVLNLCRIVYSFKNGKSVRSKIEAGEWASRKFPSEWHQLIRSALGTYNNKGNKRDTRVLRKGARRFLGPSSVRAVAFDTVWEAHASHRAHLRKRSKRGRRSR